MLRVGWRGDDGSRYRQLTLRSASACIYRSTTQTANAYDGDAIRGIANVLQTESMGSSMCGQRVPASTGTGATYYDANESKSIYSSLK
jgi:hypothetical protein